MHKIGEILLWSSNFQIILPIMFHGLRSWEKYTSIEKSPNFPQTLEFEKLKNEIVLMKFIENYEYCVLELMRLLKNLIDFGKFEKCLNFSLYTILEYWNRDNCFGNRWRIALMCCRNCMQIREIETLTRACISLNISLSHVFMFSIMYHIWEMHCDWFIERDWNVLRNGVNILVNPVRGCSCWELSWL